VESESADQVVDAGAEGTRLDRFLRDRFRGTSLSLVRTALDAGGVTVNGRPARKGDRLREGDLVRVERPPVAADWLPAADASVPLVEVWADAEIVVVAKPAGVPCVPLRPDETGTVAGALIARYPQTAGIGRTPRDSGLVSRLDAGTSGLLLAALTPDAFQTLVRSADAGRIVKGYLALVEGVRQSPWPRAVRRPLATLGPRGAVVVAGAQARADRDAPETKILRARAGIGETLVVVEIRKGERHQIRAHLAAIGHPIIGDVERGGRPLAGGNIALHAAWIEFPHPRTGRSLRVEAPLLEPLASAIGDAHIPVRRREGP